MGCGQAAAGGNSSSGEALLPECMPPDEFSSAAAQSLLAECPGRGQHSCAAVGG